MTLYRRGEVNMPSTNKEPKQETYTKIPIPNGRLNSFRVNALALSDLLKQIQNNWDSKCVVSAIKGETQSCLYRSDTITKKISEIIGDKIDNKVRSMNPKTKEETDEEYEIRLLYWYMEIFYPSKLKEIRCEECLNKWLNTNNW